MDYGDAFSAAGAPLHSPRNQWSAIDPNGEFIAVTVWQHEWEKGYGGKKPRQGPVQPAAKLYFGNTEDDLREWADNRARADRPTPNATYGWKLLKEHHQRATDEGLPVRIIMVVARGGADGSERASVKDAKYKEEWQAKMNYFDPASGAYEYAIWVV